jgi:hypothetical protein
MTEVTPERRLRAQAAAHARWSRVRPADRRDATAAARAGLQARFEREVDPDGVLPAHERAVMVENARKAYFAAITARSLATRRKGRGVA